ncbi:MAG: hypothetical protein MJY67_03135 [Bacteroidales bacterium]|nr:hypothetical protein [Bacteroidales bacterium]
MKKLFILLASFAMMASCAKENIVAPQNGTTITLTVNDGVWENDTKTAFDKEDGRVKVTGTENITLFYKKPGNETFEAPVVATPTPEGNGNYTFTAPAGSEGSTWYPVLPSSSAVIARANSNKNVSVVLSPVQCPSKDSFDPQFDYLAGMPFTIDEEASSAEIKYFKRLFTPVLVKISGLEEYERIFAVTMTLSQKNTPLTGLVYMALDEEYDETKVTSIHQNAQGPAVSALYDDEGLAAENGVYPVWFMTAPFTFNAGCEVTLTVTTQLKTYEKTLTVKKDVKLTENKAFSLPFNMAGASNVPTIAVPFFNVERFGNVKLMSSNGTAYQWPTSGTVWAAATRDNSGLLKNALNLNSTNANKTLTIPQIPGQRITKVRIFTHAASTCKKGSDAHLTLDENDYEFNLFNGDINKSSLFTTGGFRDIEIEGVDLSGKVISSSASNCMMSAMLLYTDPSDSRQDYYQEFLSGKSISINGVEYNKSTHPNFDCVDLTGQSNYGKLVSEGIHFVENPELLLNPNNTTFNNDVVLIGRYADSQTVLGSSDADKKQFIINANVVFKNLDIYPTNGTAAFSDSGTTKSPSLVVEDCTLRCQSGAVLIREVGEAYSFRELAFNNSIMLMGGKTFYEFKTTTATQLEKISIQNSVISTPSSVAINLFGFNNASYATPELELDIVGNTFYNYASNPFRMKQAKHVNISQNVFFAGLSSNAQSYTQAEANEHNDTSPIEYNFGYSTNQGYNWSAYPSATQTNTGSKLKAKSNILTSADNPFLSEDSTIGYYPINTSVVTNGAGATYETKAWRSWE